MITLDKIKLVASLDCIIDYDETLFSVVREKGIVRTMKFKTEEPFSLSIEIHYDARELVLEFTGKILGKDYPKLISIDTIGACFDKLNKLGVCRIDPAKMMSAEVVKCDVTKDIPIDDVASLAKYIKGAVRNYDTFSCTKFRNGNLIVEKNVSTHKRKKRLTIYNKEHEMNLHTSRTFVTRNDLEGQYDGLCRFELNLTSKQQIREALHTNGNTLAEVLQADANPIYDFLSDVLTEDAEGKVVSAWKDFRNLAVLAVCDYDLSKVEAKMKQFKKAGSFNITNGMRPFREILAGLPADKTVWTKNKLLDAVR